MRRSIKASVHPTSRYLTGLVVSVLLVACAAPPSGPEAPYASSLPEGDGAVLATWIDEICDRDPHTRQACREAAAVRIAESRGIAAAMDAVARLDATDGEGHVLTHMIGIRGYRGAERVGEAFAECTPIHQSGCYHGVVQAYFGEARQAGDPLSRERVNDLCAGHRRVDGDRWLLFQCLHGMGHGVMLVHDNHLPQALESCDLLSSSWEREVCYGGVFMENVMTVVAPHHDHVGATAAQAHHGEHPPATEPEAHAHEHHQHHEHHEHATGHADHGSADAFPAIDPDDPHYPCSVLEARYQPSCYDMQTAVMLHLFDGDVAATAAACREAPDGALRAICHRSLGRDINAITYGVHAESAALCALAEERDRPSCHIGVVKNVIDVTANAADGVAYCQQVPQGRERDFCYRAIGEQTVMLMPDPADRRRFCETLAAENREACHEGARVHLEYGPVPAR